MGALDGLGQFLGTLLGSSGDSTFNSDLRFYMGASALSAGYMSKGGTNEPGLKLEIRPEPTEFERLSNHKFHELLDKFEEMKDGPR